MISGAVFLLLLLIITVTAHDLGGSDEDRAWYDEKLSRKQVASGMITKAHVLRLGPGEDLLESLWKYARVAKIKAASVVSVVGSLTQTNLRYANQEDGTSLTGHFEIVSVVGNIDLQQVDSPDYEGSGHVHLSCSDEKGVTVGGHVLKGNIVYTTAEITIIEMLAVFDRVLDDGPNGSGYYELIVDKYLW